MKRLFAAIVFALMIPTASFAGSGSSTIDPTQPAFGSGLTSAVMRSQFQAAVNDINALIKNNAGTAAPTSPALGQMWLNISVTPYLLQQWDGAVWVTLGSVDPVAHAFSAMIGGTAVTLPVPVAIGGTGAPTAWQARSALCPYRSVPSGTSDTATTADCIVGWNSSTLTAKTQTIPACTSGNAGFDIEILDETGGNLAANPITVTPVSGTILLAASWPINSAFGWLHLRCNGATTNYVEIG